VQACRPKAGSSRTESGPSNQQINASTNQHINHPLTGIGINSGPIHHFYLQINKSTNQQINLHVFMRNTTQAGGRSNLPEFTHVISNRTK